MNLKSKRRWVQIAMLCGGAGTTLLQGCPFGAFLSSCFGEDTISASEYDDLNIVERLLYEENDCGRYEPRTIR